MAQSLVDRVNNVGTKSAYSYSNFGAFGDYFRRLQSNNSYELQDRKYDLALAYLYIEPVRSAINLYAETMASIPVQLVTNTTGNPDDDKVIASSKDVGAPRHPALAYFKKHKRTEFTDYFMQQMLEWKLYDELATELVRPSNRLQREQARRRGIANGLKVLRGAALSLNGYAGKIHSFYYSSDDPDNTTLDPQDVAYMRGYHPLTDYYGSSSLLATLDELNILQAVRNHSKRTLKKAHRPDVFASAGTENQAVTLNERQVKQLENQVDRYRNNDDMTMLLLGAPLRFSTVPAPNASNQVPLSEDSRKAIYRVYGVNPDLVGDSSTVNYKQDSGILANFITNQMKPAIDAIYDYNNEEILPQLPGVDETMRLVPDLSQYDIVSEPERDSIEVSTLALEKGAITFGEYADRTKFNVPEFMTDFIMVESIPVPPEAVAELWKLKYQAPAIADYAQAEENMADAEATAPDAVGDIEDVVAEDVSIEPDTKAQKALDPEREAFAYIPLANHPQILSVMQMVKDTMPSDNVIEWQTAPTYHVTLCYAQSVHDESLVELSQSVYVPPKLNIVSTSLATFETPDGYALHLAVDHNDDIDALQESVHMQFDTYGNGVSEFSNPENYNPHITLAYIKEDTGWQSLSDAIDLMIIQNPAQAIVGRDDYEPVAIITGTQLNKSSKAAHDELMTWQKYAKKRIKSDNVQDALTFESAILDPLLMARVRGRLKATTDMMMVESIFDDAISWCDHA